MASAHSFTLQNGLKFIVAEDHAAPVAAVSFWTRAGVLDEPPRQRGLAHVLEHMMFRGSAQVGPEEHARRIARLGGESNAFTSHDVTVYHEKVPARVLEEAFRLEADRFQRLRPTESLLNVERKVILEELRVYENQPAARAMLSLLQTIGGEHPYALSPIGRKEDLETMTLADLSTFYARLYRPGNIFGVVCGDVTAEQVEALARRYFEGWAQESPQEEIRPAPAFLPLTGTLSVRLPLEVPATARIHRLGPSGQEDRPALELLAAVLTDGETSPVRATLVRKTRLCLEAGVLPLSLRRGGLLAFFGLFLPPVRHARCRAILKDLCDRLAADGPDPVRFSQALKRFRKERAEHGYSVTQRMQGLGQAEVLEGDYRHYEQQLEDLARVTPERVQRRAQKLFAAENTLELDITPERTRWWTWPLGLLLRLRPRW